MRILTVSCLYPPKEPNGGASIYAHTLTKEFAKSNEVLVFAGGINVGDNLYEVLSETYDGIDIVRINLDYESFDQPIRRLLGSKKIISEFEKVLNTFKPDIVHFHSIQGLGIGIVQAAQKMGIKTAVTLHDSWWLCPRQFFLKNDKSTFCQEKGIANCTLCYGFLEEKTKVQKNFRKEYEIILRDKTLESTFKKIDYKIFPSKFLHNIYAKHYRSNKNWFVSQNGVKRPKGISDDKSKKSTINFMYVGGGSIEKGANLLIDTWQEYFSNKEKITLNIYGSNTEDIASSIYAPNINMYGKYLNANISEIFKSNDVLIFPSIIPENSPITIKEAMSFSLPVIASNMGGIPELIDDHTNGLIFENNSKVDLSDQIQSLSSRETINKYAANTANSVQYVDDQAKSIIDIFSKQKKSQSNETPQIIFDSLNSLYYFSKDNPNKTKSIFSIWSINRIKKIGKSLLFNLDHKRTGYYKENTKIIKKNINNLVEIHKHNSKLAIDGLDQNEVIGSKLKVWSQIHRLARSKKIHSIVLPYSEFKSFNFTSKLLCFLSGINKFVTINQNKTIEHQIHFKLHPSSIDLFRMIRILVKACLYVLILPVYILFVLYSLTTTTYGRTRIKKLLNKTLKIFFMALFNIISLPLNIIKQVLLLIVNMGISK